MPDTTVQLKSTQQQNGEMLALRHKTVVRTINSIANHSEGIYTGAEVDEYLSSLMQQNWTLNCVKTLGLTANGIMMVWVFTR